MRLILLLLLFCLSVALSAQDSLHMHLVGHLDFAPNLADVEGYVAPNGQEYAIVTHTDGVAIVSLANPTQPFVLHDLPGVVTINREAEVFGEYAFVSGEVSTGLRIIDLSGLPGAIAYKDTILDSAQRAHTLYIADSTLYLHFTNTTNGTLVYALADPWNPVPLGAYHDEIVHDGYVRDRIGYLCEPSTGRLKIVDFHNPAQPLVLGSVQTPIGSTHNSWLSDNGQVCYIAEEQWGAKVTAYDVSDPANITELDRIAPSYAQTNSIPHNVKVFQDWLVTAHYVEGVHITDAARPHNLIEVGYYDHSTLTAGNFSGSWGADADLPSGLILSGDIENGLFVMQPNYLRACYLEGQVTDQQTGLPLLGATVSVQALGVQEATNGDGEYATGTVHPGTYAVLYHQPGYHDSLVTVTLANGVLSLVNVPLRPYAPVRVQIQVVEAGTGLPLGHSGLSFVLQPDALTRDFQTDAAGLLDTPLLTQGMHTLYVGHWGHETVALPLVHLVHDTSFSVALARGYADPFAVDLGWTRSSTATTGDWVMGIPLGTTLGFNQLPCAPGADIGSDVGDRCYVTGNGGGDAADDDVDLGTVILRSPSMDLSGHDQPWIHLSRWFCTRWPSGSAGLDSMWIELDNGNTTARLLLTTQNLAAWVRDSFLVSSYLPLTSDMRLSVRVKERQFDHIVEAAIDGFWVSGTPLTAQDDPQQRPSAALTAYPNPGQGPVTLQYKLGGSRPSSATRIALHDLAGRLLYTQAVSGSAGEVHLAMELPAGCYVATLYGQAGALAHVRVLR
jgi:choice-of-anchor B domain-containing protein